MLLASKVSLKWLGKSGAERTGLLIRIDLILQNESLQSFVQSNLAFFCSKLVSGLTVEEKLAQT
jgi:hypothetical protein